MVQSLKEWKQSKMNKTPIEKINDEIIVGAHSVTMPKAAFDIIYRDFMSLQKKIAILKKACEQYDDMELHPTERTLQLSPAAQALKDIEEIR